MNSEGYGSSCDLIEVLSWHIPEETEENHEKPSVIAKPQPRFKPSAFQTQVQSVTLKLAYSVIFIQTRK
jgi:hypothetical protein